jgi:hypothetical protein
MPIVCALVSLFCTAARKAEVVPPMVPTVGSWMEETHSSVNEAHPVLEAARARL